MQTSFWQKLYKTSKSPQGKPIIGLSPMDGVTDQPYRFIHKKHGNPSVIYTEFVSVEGLCHNAISLLKDFIYDASERPIVAQIYGTTPAYYRQVAVLLCELGFDGIDINMGCPAKNVAHSGAGAALIKTPKLAQEIVRETKAGVQDWLNGMELEDCKDISPRIIKEVGKMKQRLINDNSTVESIPVSVKTRMGFDSTIVEDWIGALLETEPVVIAIHGRTLKQGLGGFANWDEIAKAVELSKKYSSKGKDDKDRTLILGNGDIKSHSNALQKIEKYGVDGVLIGRASFGNPFVFKENKGCGTCGSIEDIRDGNFMNECCRNEIVSRKLKVAIEHADVYEKVYKEFAENIKDTGVKYNYNFLPMRKNLGWYVRGMMNAKEVRAKLFKVNSSDEVKEILSEYIL